MKLLHTTDFIDLPTEYNGREYFHASVDQGVFFVAETNRKIIGLIHGEMLMGNGCAFWSFIVDDKFRGQGLGKELLTAFEKECKSRGATWIYSLSDRNEKTENFYRKNGFTFGNAYTDIAKKL